MNEYKYTAIMINGKKVTDRIMAKDYNDAKKLLREKKLKIIEIKDSLSSPHFKELVFKNTHKQRANYDYGNIYVKNIIKNKRSWHHASINQLLFFDD